MINSKDLIQDKIKKYLIKKDRASSSDIAKKIKHNRITVTKYLELMKAHKIIDFEEIAQAKLWYLTNKNNNKKILVVDDEPHIVQLIKLTLSKPNIEIIEAYSGFEALEKVKIFNPDLIILDLMMPGLNGFEVCRKLKSEAITQHIPIIILSAKNQIEDKFKGCNAGAEEYFTKPFDPIEFEAMIYSFLSSFEKEIDVNPLTKLPGKTSLISYLNDSKIKKFFIYQIKIIDLKKFNKNFGWKKSNDLVILLSKLINEKILQNENSRAFHLIGNVFIVTTTQKDFVEDLNSTFKRLLPFIYSNINTKNKISLEIKLINKSIKFKDINLIIKKIEDGE
ncbi:MAG: response regulator [Candidatus Woesearchaeota archaeon]